MQSRIEELLQAIIDGKSASELQPAQSRMEQQFIDIITGGHLSGTPQSRAEALLAQIQSGGGGEAVLIEKYINSNGNYIAKDDNADGYSKVNVEVPNSYTILDEGKVVNGGQLVEQTARAETITENGSYGTTLNSSVVVDIPEPTGTIEITENGTVDVKDYASAAVNVSGGGGDDPFELTDYIECSETQYIDTGYIVKDNSRFDVVYIANKIQKNFPALFGVRNNDSGATAGRCTFFVKHTKFSAGSYAWGTADADMGLSARMYLSAKKQRCIFTKGALKVQQADGNVLMCEFASAYSASNTQSIYIFTLNQGGADYGTLTHFSGKLYRFRIYEGETLVHEFLPWLDGNNVACLKDTVTGDLKYNAGTGAFTYGTDA